MIKATGNKIPVAIKAPEYLSSALSSLFDAASKTPTTRYARMAVRSCGRCSLYSSDTLETSVKRTRMPAKQAAGNKINPRRLRANFIYKTSLLLDLFTRIRNCQGRIARPCRTSIESLLLRTLDKLYQIHNGWIRYPKHSVTKTSKLPLDLLIKHIFRLSKPDNHVKGEGIQPSCTIETYLTKKNHS